MLVALSGSLPQSPAARNDPEGIFAKWLRVCGDARVA